MSASPILEGRGLSKHFGPIEACRSVDIEVFPGQLTAIVGDNGAGKSTLVKMLCGALRPDEGEIAVDGKVVFFSDPLDARSMGIEPVYQDLALAPNLDVAANVFLGRELRRNWGLPFFRPLDKRAMRVRAAEELERLQVSIPRINKVPVERMSGGQRQCVAVARAAHWATKVLIMDEPTAALGVRESERVLRLVKSITAERVAVIMISHILPHVIELADHVIVMRHGRRVAMLRRGEATMDVLVKLIVGAEADVI